MRRFALLIRKVWWLVLLGALTGVVVSYATGPRVDVYQARALVVAIEPNVEDAEVAGVLSSIFSTDAVLTPTRDQLAIDATPQQLLSSGSLAAQPGASDLAVSVTARARNAVLAVDLANTAAQNLADVAQESGFGRFTVFPWEGDASLQGASRLVSLLGGAAVGAGVILALAAAWFALRRSPADVADIALSEATYRVDVTATSNGAATAVDRPEVLAAAWASLDAAARRKQRRVAVIVVTDGAGPSSLDVVVDELDGLAARKGGGGATLERWSEAELGEERDPVDAFAVVAAREVPTGRLIDVRRRVDPSREAFVALLLVSRR